MRLEIEDEQGLLSEEMRSLLFSCADAVEKTENAPVPCAAFLRITNDQEIQVINKQFRETDRATDVLSFPTISYEHGKTARDSKAELLREWDDDYHAAFIGDIIIAHEHAENQAEEYGHSVKREYGYLLTHGLFHLMGYDHMIEEEKKVMREMEEKALNLTGLSRKEEEE